MTTGVPAPERGRDPAGGTTPASSATLRFGVLLAVLTVVALAIWLTPLRTLVTRAGALALLTRVRAWPLAPLAFVLLYTTAATLALPGSALTLAGGALFGLWGGFALNWLGATAGATLAFLLARRLGRDFVQRRLRGRVAALDERAERHGFRAVLLLRLVPLVPFNALNYGAGVSSVRLRDYIGASAIGMLPGCFAYTYFADAILAGSLHARRSAYLHVLLAGALLLALSLLPLLWKRLHRPPPPARPGP